MKLKWQDHTNAEWADLPVARSFDTSLYDKLLINQEIAPIPERPVYTKVPKAFVKCILFSKN